MMAESGPLQADQVDYEALKNGWKPSAERVAPKKPGFKEKFMTNLKREAPGLVGTAVAGVIPGGKLAGPLKRIIAGTGADYLTRRVLGTPRGEAATQSITGFAPGQALGEVIGGGASAVRSQRIGAQQYAAQEAQQKAYQLAHDQFPAAKAAQNAALEQKQTHLTAAQAEAHSFARQAARQKSAKDLVTAAQSTVPAWKGIPATEEGLYRITRGPERLKVNDAFDEAFKKSLPAPGTTYMQITARDAAKLKITGVPGKNAPSPTGALDSTQYVKVDARDAANAVLGTGKTDPGLHNRVVAALDAANVGDPAAREMYRNAQALLAFSDQAKIFKGKELQPEKIVEGLGNWKAGGQIVKRQGGGPLYEAASRVQPVPPASDLQVKPPSPLTPPVKPDAPVTKKTVSPGAEILGPVGMVGGALAGQQFHHPWVGGTLGMGAGAAAGRALGSVPSYSGQTVPPLGRVGRAAQGAVPSIIGELTRIGVPEVWKRILSDD